jgi:hypothetical protein
MMARKPLELPPTLPRLRQGHASLPRRAQRHLSLRPSRPGSRVIDHATASKMRAEITDHDQTSLDARYATPHSAHDLLYFGKLNTRLSCVRSQLPPESVKRKTRS